VAAKTTTPIMIFQGIIFDFNGVLLWDAHLQEQAWRQFAVEIRGRLFSDEDLAEHMHGRTNQYVLEYVTGRQIIGDELRQLTQQKEAIYRRLCLAQPQDFVLSPGAVDLLSFLVGQHIPHTIATASEKTNLDFFVTYLDLNRWFNLAQIVYDDSSRPGKPAPDVYLQAAYNLGLLPAQCVVVEDSRAGLQAACAAGIGHIVALGPADTHPQLRRIEGVNQVVESLEQIPREALFS
jgi:beta-phosphoglucomutase-like phosphatase (HAD superfamily)